MDQEELRREMQQAAEVLIRTKRSDCAVAFPHSNARARFDAIAATRKRRDAFFSTSILLLVVIFAGRGGPSDEVAWLLPVIGFIAVVCIATAFSFERIARRQGG